MDSKNEAEMLATEDRHYLPDLLVWRGARVWIVGLRDWSRARLLANSPSVGLFVTMNDLAQERRYLVKASKSGTRNQACRKSCEFNQNLC